VSNQIAQQPRQTLENLKAPQRVRDSRDDVAREIGGEPLHQHDGRNVDPSAGLLHGEGALQDVKRLEPEKPSPEPHLEDSSSDLRSYYGLPVLKETVWKASTIPTYFYVGGLAGASCALGAAAQLLGGQRLSGLVRRAHVIGLGGSVVSAFLLVEDLGKPQRFLNMLRVFRPTSPMSVGSWVLAAFGAGVSLAALPQVAAPFRAGIARNGALKTLSGLGSIAAGVLGLPLCGYTAVLLANTAVPTWQGARTALPPLFVSSAASSAEAVLSYFASTPREERVLRRFGAAAKAVELVAMQAVEAELARAPRAAQPLQRGLAGALWLTAKICTAAGLLLALRPRSGIARRSRWRKVAAAALGTAGGLCTRFAIFQAGRVSSRDPLATFEPQRRGLGAAARAG
jgi:formate-dependent nitrite reductase membrane component NrfD